MRGGGIEVVVELLHVLAVVSFLPGESEQALLEDGIAPVPQGHRKAKDLVAVRDAGDAVLVPAIRARSRMVVGQVVPRGSVLAVILANGAPGALAQVRPPPLPVLLAIARLGQPDLFGGH